MGAGRLHRGSQFFSVLTPAGTGDNSQKASERSLGGLGGGNGRMQ